MICPYCGKEMERGYIQSRDGVFWTPDRVAVPALTVLNRKSVPVSTDPGIMASAAVAHLCRECKKVVIDYNRD